MHTPDGRLPLRITVRRLWLVDVRLLVAGQCLHANILSNSSCILDYIAIHIVTSSDIPPAFSNTLLLIILDCFVSTRNIDSQVITTRR